MAGKKMQDKDSEMIKPYYDLQTGETYRKVKNGNIHIKFITGSVELIGNLRIEKNEFGKIIKTERTSSREN